MSNTCQQFVMSRAISAGYPAVSAAAIVGNGCQESGPNLDSTFERAHSDEGSGGFLEWRLDRKTALGAFADQRGVSRDDLGVQVDFCIFELSNDYPSLNVQLKDPGSRPLKNLVANFMLTYERPRPSAANLDNRILHAAQALADWNAKEVVVPPFKSDAIDWDKVKPSIVSSTTAGRQAAVLDQLKQISQTYADEISSLQAEKIEIDAAIINFSKHYTAVTMPVLPPPTQGPKQVGKAAVSSKSFWGSLIALAVPVASQVADALGHSVDPKWQALGSTLGGFIALYGTMTRTLPITGILKP